MPISSGFIALDEAKRKGLKSFFLFLLVLPILPAVVFWAVCYSFEITPLQYGWFRVPTASEFPSTSPDFALMGIGLAWATAILMIGPILAAGILVALQFAGVKVSSQHHLVAILLTFALSSVPMYNYYHAIGDFRARAEAYCETNHEKPECQPVVNNPDN